jgi:hypothetical protein
MPALLDRVHVILASISADTLLVALTAGLVAALGIIISLEWRLRKLTRGRDAASLEETIRALNTSAQEAEAFRADMERYLTGVEKRLRRSIQRVETVRFNPFKGTGDGGNQSFASAFLSEEGDGIILSSIYARDRMSVFAKPIEKKKSSFELTEEERETVQKAADALEKA